ncbi:MAG: YlzJ-like family protein [Bacillota bacterium]
MVLYSIYPPEVVLGQVENPEPRFFTVELDGRTLVLEMKDGRAQIVRLLSTNPRDYLDSRWQPGQALGFGPHPET